MRTTGYGRHSRFPIAPARHRLDAIRLPPNDRDPLGMPSWRWVVMWAALVGIVLAGMFGFLPRPTKETSLLWVTAVVVGVAAAVYLRRERIAIAIKHLQTNTSTMLSIDLIDLARQSLGRCLGQGKEGRVFAVSRANHPQAMSSRTLKELVNTEVAKHELEVHQELSNNPEMHSYVTRLYTHKCGPTGDLDPCNTTKRQQPKQGVCYGLMERATMDLKDFLTSEKSPFVQGALPGPRFDSLCTLLGQVLKGLQVAQAEHQFTHNDLHWENVLVHSHGDDGAAQLDDMYRCKLYDFGYARTEQLQRQKLSKSQAYMRNFNSGYDLCELFAYVLDGVREKSVPLAKAERAQFETLCEHIAPEIIKAANRYNLRPKPSNTTAVSPRTALGEMSRRVELPRRLLEANKPTKPNNAGPKTNKPKRNVTLRRSRRLRSRTRPWTRARARAIAQLEG